jgi:hypothetical protein
MSAMPILTPSRNVLVEPGLKLDITSLARLMVSPFRRATIASSRISVIKIGTAINKDFI